MSILAINGGDVGVDKVRALLCELCQEFWSKGWASGTGGGMSIRHCGMIFMAPSGVLKERLEKEDVFIYNEEEVWDERDIGQWPLQVKISRNSQELKLTQCAPLFMAAYRLRNANAVLHSHSINAVFAIEKALVKKRPSSDRARGGAIGEFRAQRFEMIKGITGHTYTDSVVVPIIKNTAHEKDLTESLEAAIEAYPKTFAVLVDRHGVYVWGPTWEKAKAHAETYDYLFELAARGMEMEE